MGLKGVTRTGGLDGGFEIGGVGVFGLSQFLIGGGMVVVETVRKPEY